MAMGITIIDIKKAILGKGDVSAFDPVLRRALAYPPVSGVSSLDISVPIPESTTLFSGIDTDMTTLLHTWLAGNGYDGPLLRDLDLTLVGLAPYGRNISGCLERIIDENEPDIVTIDTSPSGLSANMLYAFGILGAVGLPVYGEILDKAGDHRYAHEAFYPGNMYHTAIVKCWLSKIPLIPVGMPIVPRRRTPKGGVDTAYFEKEMRKRNLLATYHTFDDNLEKIPSLQEKTKITPDVCRICSDLSKGIGSGTSSALMEEARYNAGRILEAASFLSDRGKKAKLLAIVDIKHYEDTLYIINLLKRGILEEVFLPPSRDVPVATVTMVSRNSAELNAYAQHHASKTTSSQKRFSKELEKLSRAGGNQQLSENEANTLITAIASRTREHPAVARGASVRGTIAFKEVVQGFKEMQGRLTRSSIEKAALVTLPHRIVTGQRDNGDAITIIGDIVKEILYGIRFYKEKTEAILPDNAELPSLEDIMAALQNMTPAKMSSGQKPQQEGKGRMLIVPDRGGHGEPSETLTSKGSPGEGSENRDALTRKNIERLLDTLEQKRMRGEVTQNQYEREKARLEEMLSASSRLQSPVSRKEMAETVMEFMEAKDEKWSGETTFQDMYIYYHIKGTGEGKPLISPKRGYYGLRVLIDELSRRGILKSARSKEGFTLTSEALDTLLEHIIPKIPKGRKLNDIIGYEKIPPSERKHSIRRYTTGDVFRDISVRHTLKEIARKQKSLSDINRRDLKVFFKKPRIFQSDIVFCMDSSGSMGFRQKLIYARLVAAGLARAALGKGDKVGMVTFDDHGRTIMPLTDKREEVFNYIAALSAGGNTNIGDGIKCATELLLREPGRNQKYIVLITDGASSAISQKAFDQLPRTKEEDLTEECAILETRAAASSGVITSVIYITGGDQADEGFVRRVADTGGGHIQRISSFEDLRSFML